MNIGNITSDNFNLDGNGKDMQIEVYEQLIDHLQKKAELGDHYKHLYSEVKKQKENKQLQQENQQKEFIKYMNGTIEDIETENVDDEEMKGYLIQRIYTFKEILQKYKEIIGDDK
nr:MAG TPA: hypothetical protein [Caudoviricetes sp.]